MELPWEDALLERKTEGYEDEAFLKTFVAFANSVRPDHTAVVLIGERDTGKIVGVVDPDKLQMRIRKIIEKNIYPPIVWRSQVYEKDGKICLRVEIEYSGETPHFGGISWIRKGSETIKATDEIFQHLINLRLGKVRELAKWIGREVTVHGDSTNLPADRKNFFGNVTIYSHRWGYEEKGSLVTVNNFWLTIKVNKKGDDEERTLSEPLDKILLSYDDQNDRLKIIVSY